MAGPGEKRLIGMVLICAHARTPSVRAASMPNYIIQIPSGFFLSTFWGTPPACNLGTWPFKEPPCLAGTTSPTHTGHGHTLPCLLGI